MFGMFSEAKNLCKKGTEVLGSYGVVSGSLGHTVGFNLVSDPISIVLTYYFILLILRLSYLPSDTYYVGLKISVVLHMLLRQAKSNWQGYSAS